MMKISKNSEILKLIKLFFIIDIGIVVFTALEANYIWFINTQFAFFSSFFITIASYISYQKFVVNNVQNIKSSDDIYHERDKLDSIEDPYDLYDDLDDEESTKTNITKEEISKLIQEEKQKLSKNSFRNTLKGLRTYSSLYRLSGYLLLILGFFYLNNHHLFHTISYFFGLFVVPFSATIYKFINIK